MEGDVISSNEIFPRFVRVSTDENGNVQGHYEATGIRPKFAEALRSANIDLPVELFIDNRRLQ